MATIKSYSDLQQSKKLAEILPLESADNIIVSFGSSIGAKTVIMPKETLDIIRTPFSDIRKTTICWSLAALLNILPKSLNIGRPSLESNYKGYYWIQYYDEFMKANDYKTECFNNPVDACYEMIIKLNELKKL